jgi:hypothetical protein
MRHVVTAKALDQIQSNSMAYFFVNLLSCNLFYCEIPEAEVIATKELQKKNAYNRQYGQVGVEEIFTLIRN